MDRITQVAAKAMNLRMERAGILASYIANKDTAGYTPLELEFSEALEKALNGEGLRRSDAGVGVGIDPSVDNGEIVFDPGRVPGEDGNSVDLDREINRQVDNAIAYQSAAKIIKKKQGFMNYALTTKG